MKPIYLLALTLLMGCKAQEPRIDCAWPQEQWVEQSAQTVEQINQQRGVAGR